MITNIMNTQILKVKKGHFYVYFNLNLCSYGQLVYFSSNKRNTSSHPRVYFFLTSFGDHWKFKP